MSAETVLAVLGRFLARVPQPITPLGNHGGFSGAALWQIGNLFCLKAWPLHGPTREGLGFIHELMERASTAGLICVPRVVRGLEGDTIVELAGRLWDLTTWQPGLANFHEHPSQTRLENALHTLARLHLAWTPTQRDLGRCPAVQRRLDAVASWIPSSRPFFGRNDPVAPWCEALRQLLPRGIQRVPGLLAPWSTRPWSLQPCLCDIWHDHVLFDGDQVTGLVDFGAIKMDHPAVDLARLLGSLIEDREEGWHQGLTAYRAVRAFSAEEEALTRALDETGVVVAGLTWWHWLTSERGQSLDRSRVAQRLQRLVTRLETMISRGRSSLPEGGLLSRDS